MLSVEQNSVLKRQQTGMKFVLRYSIVLFIYQCYITVEHSFYT